MTHVLVIDPKTDGGSVIFCELQVVDNMFRIKYGGDDGWIMAIPIQEVIEVLLTQSDLSGGSSGAKSG